MCTAECNEHSNAKRSMGSEVEVKCRQKKNRGPSTDPCGTIVLSKM